MKYLIAILTLLVSVATSPGFADQAATNELVLYSGRSKSLVRPIIKQFQQETGIKVTARYGNTAQLALAIQEEGERSPADVFWAQDAGGLGVLSKAGVFVTLPAELVESAPARFRNENATGVATSGRARVLAYSPDRVAPEELPTSIFDLTDPKWKNRIGWAPANASFQAFVTAMIVTHGEDKTRAWLTAVKANGAKAYPKNTPIIEALAAGEIDLGLPNHYYLLRFKTSNSKYPVEQTFFDAGDVGNLVNVAGVGILKTSARQDAALRFVEYLIGPKAQQYFSSQVFEYPVRDDVIPNARLVPLDELLRLAPDVQLNDLDNLKHTLNLLTEIGLL